MGLLSSTVALPLKVCIKWCHHIISWCTSKERIVRWLPCLSKLILLNILRRKTRPPLTTLAAHERRPANDWSWRLVARLRDRKLWSSSRKIPSLSWGKRRHISLESNSIPRKVIFWVGLTTFPQWMAKPSFRRSWMRTKSAWAHSSWDFAIIMKSSR